MKALVDRQYVNLCAVQLCNNAHPGDPLLLHRNEARKRKELIIIQRFQVLALLNYILQIASDYSEFLQPYRELALIVV